MIVVDKFGEKYKANQIKVSMIKTFFMNAYIDLDKDGVIDEETVEELAHEAWLDAYAAILKLLDDQFPHVELESFSTDNVELEVTYG